MIACAMSCCQDSDRALLTSVAFVLPPPMAAATVVAIKSPIELAKLFDLPRSLEPVSPPPRFVIAAA